TFFAMDFALARVAQSRGGVAPSLPRHALLAGLYLLPVLCPVFPLSRIEESWQDAVMRIPPVVVAALSHAAHDIASIFPTPRDTVSLPSRAIRWASPAWLLVSLY